MKPIKTLSLAAVAAIAAMAFVGATSAMATTTQLCKTDADTGGVTGACPLGNAVNSVHFVDPLALLFGEVLGVKIDLLCEVLFQGEVLALGSPQIIHGSFTFGKPHSGTTPVSGSCVDMQSGKNCGTVTEIKGADGVLGGLLKVLRTGLELAEVTGEKFEVLIECAGLHCIYNFNSSVFHALGPLVTGDNGHITSLEVDLAKVSGFLCPTTTKLTTLLVALPSPIYIAT